jgi:phenol 2-monooxygenase
MDAHNLAVKIALVESGVAKPEILSTYGLERRQVATHLMQLDAELIQMYADHGKSDDPEDIKKLVAFQVEHFAFQAGTDITHAANCMVDNVSHARSDMARLICGEGLIVGRRLLPASVRRFSDGLTLKILDAVPCDSRFTIFVCLGVLNSSRNVSNGLVPSLILFPVLTALDAHVTLSLFTHSLHVTLSASFSLRVR